MVRLPDQRSADRVPTFSCHRLFVSTDQLDKADALLNPEAYLYLLGVQFLVSLSDSLAGLRRGIQYLSLSTTPSPPKNCPWVQPAHRPITLPKTWPAQPGYELTRDAERRLAPALLAALSFFLTTKLSDFIFVDVLGALQTLIRAAGYLVLPAVPHYLRQGCTPATRRRSAR